MTNFKPEEVSKPVSIENSRLLYEVMDDLMAQSTRRGTLTKMFCDTRTTGYELPDVQLLTDGDASIEEIRTEADSKQELQEYWNETVWQYLNPSRDLYYFYFKNDNSVHDLLVELGKQLIEGELKIADLTQRMKNIKLTLEQQRFLASVLAKLSNKFGTQGENCFGINLLVDGNGQLEQLVLSELRTKPAHSHTKLIIHSDGSGSWVHATYAFGQRPELKEGQKLSDATVKRLLSSWQADFATSISPLPLPHRKQ